MGKAEERHKPTVAEELRSIYDPKMVASAPTPTKAQMEEIASRAEKLVSQKCLNVRLHMARRKIELLKEIKFHGSRHAKGVDVYLEPAVAEKICEEAAFAL